MLAKIQFDVLYKSRSAHGNNIAQSLIERRIDTDWCPYYSGTDHLARSYRVVVENKMGNRVNFLMLSIVFVLVAQLTIDVINIHMAQF